MASCPVYGIDRMESHVARGRNVLINLADKNQIAVEDDDYRECLYYCLLCGRCEATCPAKVSSTAITKQARADLLNQKGLTWSQRVIHRGILKHRSFVAKLLGLASRVPGLSVKEGKPLRHLADIFSVVSGGIAIPRLSSPFLSKRVAVRTDPPEGAPTRGKVAFFPGCSFEFFFAGIGKDVVFALAEAGYQVVYPPDLACCGLAVHSAGDINTATSMAERNIEVLSEFDHIVTGCATCGSALKDYGNWFPQDEAWQKKAQAVSSKAVEFSEFLARDELEPKGSPSSPLRVTYHDPCHLKWHQGISEDPRKLLRSLEGIEFVEMENADGCCGLGGPFGIGHRDVSLAIQAKKMESIKKTEAQVVATSCPGCLIQLMDGVRRHGLSVEVMHISQLIRRG
jgi:glycolate oxidase iron-sulfur subunit